MEKRVITKKAVELAKKIIKDYKSQFPKIKLDCMKCDFVHTSSYEDDFEDSRGESRSITRITYYCNQNNITNTDDMKRLWDNHWSTKNSDKKCPKWCPKRA
jgi:transposase